MIAAVARSLRAAPCVATGLALMLFGAACSSSKSSSAESDPSASTAATEGVVAEPPFAVAGDVEGLVLTWYDEEGPHVAQRRSDVPAESREHVKVDSLSVSPDDRDPDTVWVADLRAPGAGEAYEVRRFTRAGFDGFLEEAHATEAVADGSVVVYGASWCGACRQAESWLQRQGVAFEKKDIEQDASARAEMQRKAQAAGVPTSGIPIIDIRGQMLTGFDPGAMQRALDATGGVSG